MMEIKDLLTVSSLTILVIVVLALMMHFMSKLKNDKYDLELKKMHIEAMRASLENKSYNATSDLMSDPKRWADINHLVVEAMKYQPNINTKQQPAANPYFLENAGIDINNIQEIKKRVFVLTPFHDRYQGTYEIIKSACSDLGLECVRGDEEFRPGNVLSHILEVMLSSAIVIANIDGRNANVYYELGIAHALGKKTLLIASDISKVPFDMQSQRIILFSNKEELAKQLTIHLARNLMTEQSFI